MPAYILRYNGGYGDNHEVEEFDDLQQAESEACRLAEEDAMNNVDYEAILLTEESAEEYGFEEEYEELLREE